MIYNFNLGIGWASSGVEYAQAYRAKVLRNIGKEARFVFTDMFPKDGLIEMTRNIGFEDQEIIWLYTFFSDFKPSPVTYTLNQLKAGLGGRHYKYERTGKTAKLIFDEKGCFYTVYFTNERDELVHRVEMVSRGCLIRKDYYTYGRIFSEYYGPLDNRAYLYQRRFFNEDGSVAYEEIIDGDATMYKFPDQVLCSKPELVAYMVRCLKLTDKDIVIIDRTTGVGQAILSNAAPAKVGIVIHADHFSEPSSDEYNILWNNYYEYAFSQQEHIAFFVTATEDQRKLLLEQFKHYKNVEPRVCTIPVGSLPELKYPTEPRRRHSLITASRLAKEKHVDWMIQAVAEAHKAIPDISLDIYGKGGEEESLRRLITQLHAKDYIHLMGQHDLTDVYVKYEAYLSASTSEGFGLTLMEAIGSGLPIIGFDVRYGNQNFIDNGANGYKLYYMEGMEKSIRQKKMVEAIVKLFTVDNVDEFAQHSYEKAQKYLTKEVEEAWKRTIDETI